MKDIAGRELRIGQIVASTVVHVKKSLVLCEVVGFSTKMVFLRYKFKYFTEDEFTDIKRYPVECAIIGELK